MRHCNYNNYLYSLWHLHVAYFYVNYLFCLLDDIMANEVSSMGKKYNYYAIHSNGITLCLAYPNKHNMITIR